MRLLLLSLCSLFLLYVSVSCHPMARHRANRLGMLFRQKWMHPEKMGQDSSVSMSDDVASSSNDSSVVTEIEPEVNKTQSIAARRPSFAMFRRRKPCRDRSPDRCHDSSEHNSRGSASGSKDVEDWMEQLREKCGLQMEMMEKLEKVAPAEIRSVVSSSAAMLEKVAHGFTKHSMDIADLEANMDGQTPEQLVESHINLLYQFKDLVESAEKEGMCDFVSMQMLLDRITYLGSKDFGDSRCNEANRMVSTLDGISPEMNARQQITLMWLYRFGAAIRNDMNCIVNDIEALRQHVNSLKKLTETDGASLREVHIGLSTTMAYEGILEHELDQFRRAVELVGEALPYIDLGQLPDANIKRLYRSVADSLKRLLSNV